MSRYGRDYYINDARTASGTRKKNGEWFGGGSGSSTTSTPANTPTGAPAHGFYVSDYELYFKSKNRMSFNDKYNTLSSYRSVNSDDYRRLKNIGSFKSNDQYRKSTGCSDESRQVKRSVSLNSLRSYNHLRQGTASDLHYNSERSNYTTSNRSSVSSVEIPANIIAELEVAMLHGNLKRDSFRSRSSTKNFVTNPIFDERQE